MADNKTKPAAKTNGGNNGNNNRNNGGFTPTFRTYASLSDGEKEAFKQGATTANNNIKERLGLKKPRD